MFINKLILPLKVLIKELSCLKLLCFDYGHTNTIWQSSCIDKDNNPIPWYTYPAIEYIKQLDFSDKSIFEYGSGNSSLFWGTIAKKTISIENDKHWYQKILKQTNQNMEIKLVENKDSYAKSIHEYNEKFDIIIIDSINRCECALKSIQKLNQGGMIILDNSDWHPKAAKILREANFVQVDMSGFGPIGRNTWVTSFFFQGNFNFKPLKDIQPKPCIGNVISTITESTK